MDEIEEEDDSPPLKKRKIDYDVVNSFLCPITKEVFVEPYILVDTGITYEQSAIRKWLQDHNTCPMSNIKLRTKRITKNKILETLIEEHINNNLNTNIDVDCWRQKRVLSKVESIVRNWELFPKDYLLQYIQENNSFLNKRDHSLLTMSIQNGQEELTNYIFRNWELDFRQEKSLVVKDRYYYPINLNGPLGDIHLFLAVMLGYEEIVEIFLDYEFINPNFYNQNSNQTLLSISSWYGDLGITERLLSHPKFDLTAPLINGQPQWVDALSNCAFHGYTPILDKLLSFEVVDPNQGDNQLSEQVPLIIAVERNNYKIIKRLLDCPTINVNIHEYFSGDPLIHFAVRMKDYQLLEIVLDCPKFNLNEKNDQHLSIMELIYLKDDSLALRMLLDKIKLERV